MSVWRIVPGLLILFIGFCVSQRAVAAPIFALGTNVVYEVSADGRRYEARQPLSLRGGYRFELADTYLEYTNFRVAANGVSMLNVAREHQEFLFWGRKVFRSDWVISPSAALGVGFEHDRVSTNFGSERSEEQGSPTAIMATALGVRVQVVEHLDLQFEGRLGFGSEYQPSPLFGFGIAFGVIF